MQKWEYISRYVLSDPKETIDRFDVLGQDGWELVGFIRDINLIGDLAFFKRPLEPDEEPKE